MHFTSIFALSLVGAVAASPTALSPRLDWKTERGWDGTTTTPAQLDPSNVVRPTPGKPAAAALTGGVYFCDGINWTIPCLYVSGFSSNQCVNFGNDFNDKVSSFGPDNTIKCYLWSDWDCKGTKTIYLTNPGAADLRTINFNDKDSSFQCVAV
ncbi:hypothetical protein BDV93DRAFT_526448 [Ceratobasidium sp. AG-I]|nr:hypothetical protein BDV93DRAFT_526448 [Ceratobasidium sp. AG-I]